jgi:hypothetical protein
MERNFIECPRNTICDTDSKIEILSNRDEFIAIDKPVNVIPVKIIGHMIDNIPRKQFAELEISFPKEVFSLESKISGKCLMAKTKTSATELRDLCGSQLFEFTFDLLSLPMEIGTVSSHDLFIGKHFSDG